MVAKACIAAMLYSLFLCASLKLCDAWRSTTMHQLPSARSLAKNQIRSRATVIKATDKMENKFMLRLNMVNSNGMDSNDRFDLAAWFNPNTRGGVIVWSFLLTLIPIGVYNIFTAQGLEGTTVGAYVGAIFVLLSNLLWASTYVFRVANKDMTYAKQLKDYENAVLQKRLDELADDEINALMDEIQMEETRKGLESIVTKPDEKN